MFSEVSYMSDGAKRDLGYRANEMFLYCTFNGDNCNLQNDFWEFYNPTYGNCFTFNSDKVSNQTSRFTSNAGPQFGKLKGRKE